MGIEIERKFLVRGNPPLSGEGARILQNYLVRSERKTVRVRTKGGKGYLAIKGPSSGAARLEFEYEIPYEDATSLLAHLCDTPPIEKTRYEIEYEGLTWEVDVFAGANTGLVLAEVELESESQKVSLPGWVGQEVTGDERYFNAYLVAHPYQKWGNKSS
ncbi:MAG: CYTH domain-containing protein [Verrucomicrobia bacterium]|nr:CYTH domain-containing protein [Verrucomicrobiota bacterium]